MAAAVPTIISAFPAGRRKKPDGGERGNIFIRLAKAVPGSPPVHIYCSPLAKMVVPHVMTLGRSKWIGMRAGEASLCCLPHRHDLVFFFVKQPVSSLPPPHTTFLTHDHQTGSGLWDNAG